MKAGDESIPSQVIDVGYIADSYKQPSTAIYNNVNPTLSASFLSSFQSTSRMLKGH